MHILRTKPAFTLVEMLLALAMLVAAIGISAPFFQRAVAGNNLNVATFTVANAMRRAQVLARSAQGDSSWGVKVQTTSVTVFRGTSYMGLPEDKFPRDTSYDEVYEISLLSVTGLSEVVMAKVTGNPSPTGTVTLAVPGNLTRTVTINSLGMVSY